MLFYTIDYDIRLFMKYTRLLTYLFLSSSILSHAQNNRITDHNAIGWYTYNGDVKVNKRWALHSEYQWRRVNLIRSWQQSLARLGVMYSLKPNVQISSGYTYLITYPYGEHPVADQGVPTREHRIYEDIQGSHRLSKLALEHRIRLEQRWMGEPAGNKSRRMGSWDFANRIRYQLELRYPLKGATIDEGEFYLTAFDELFLNLGKDDHAYNQNRILAGLGYQFSDDLQLELGYLYQITRHADLDAATNRPVYENNRGFRFNLIYELDLTK